MQMMMHWPLIAYPHHNFVGRGGQSPQSPLLARKRLLLSKLPNDGNLDEVSKNYQLELDDKKKLI